MQPIAPKPPTLGSTGRLSSVSTTQAHSGLDKTVGKTPRLLHSTVAGSIGAAQYTAMQTFSATTRSGNALFSGHYVSLTEHAPYSQMPRVWSQETELNWPMLPARAVVSVADASSMSGYSLPLVSRGSAETTVFNCCGSKPISHLCRRGSNPYKSSPLQDTVLRIEQEARQQRILARSSFAGGPGSNVNNGSRSSTQMGARHRYLPVQNGHANHGVAASNDSNIHNIGPMQTPCAQPLLSKTEMHWLAFHRYQHASLPHLLNNLADDDSCSYVQRVRGHPQSVYVNIKAHQAVYFSRLGHHLSHLLIKEADMEHYPYVHWLEDATRSIIIADISLMSLVYPDNSQLS